jgi:hypothetical protein
MPNVRAGTALSRFLETSYNLANSKLSIKVDLEAEI